MYIVNILMRERGSHEIDPKHRSHLFHVVEHPRPQKYESDKDLGEKARITMVEALKTAPKGSAGRASGSEYGEGRRSVLYTRLKLSTNKNTKKVYIDAVLSV